MNKPGLQAVVGVVDAAQRFVEILVRLDGHDGAENFLAVHFHVRLGAGQHRRINHGTLAATAAQQARAGANRFLHPVGDADGIALANQRTDVGRFLHADRRSSVS